MLKRLALLCLFSSAMYAGEIAPPSFISFDQSNIHFEQESFVSGLNAFNGSPELRPFFEMLTHDYPISAIVETGTHVGSTTAFFANICEEIHTVDISEEFMHKAKQSLSSFPNIHFHLGSSEKVLTQLLPTLKDRFTLFYLDAHWKKYWPLLDELEVISKTHHQQCIIVIDDIKVPGRADIPYDSYKKRECSLEYVRAKVEKVFDNYSVHYLIPANVNTRAKLVILPR